MNLLNNPARAAQIAACAEAQGANVLTLAQYGTIHPQLDADWEHIAPIYARNALFIGAQIQVGDPVWFGFVAKYKGATDDAVDHYIVAFRGTHQRIEWLEDAAMMLVPHPVSGLVEHGFWGLYTTATCNNLPAAVGVLELLGPPAARPRTVTCIGHSLGAPLATYLARDLAAACEHMPHNQTLVQAALFASPKPGDAHFALDFDKLIGHDNYRVWNYLRDVVPRLPPSLPFGLGFQNLANVVVIRPSDSTTKIADNIVSNHRAESYAALLGAPAPSTRPIGAEL